MTFNDLEKIEAHLRKSVDTWEEYQNRDAWASHFIPSLITEIRELREKLAKLEEEVEPDMVLTRDSWLKKKS